MNKKDYLLAFICLVICSGILFVGYKKAESPVELYRVYLQGKTIGYIKNKELLEEYIDNEQYELKEKYKVSTINMNPKNKPPKLVFSSFIFIIYLCIIFK